MNQRIFDPGQIGHDIATRDLIDQQTSRIARLEAALAAAHEALDRASSWVESNRQSAQWTRNRIQVISADECRREGDSLRSALSAPALARAAEELRLLRGLETLDRGCADTTEHLEALRRFREEDPDAA